MMGAILAGLLSGFIQNENSMLHAIPQGFMAGQVAGQVAGLSSLRSLGRPVIACPPSAGIMQQNASELSLSPPSADGLQRRRPFALGR